MVANSIPASQFVSGTGGVINQGGSPLSLNAVFVDTDPSIPFGTVQGFPSLLAVQNWFGANSTEALLAEIYFSGFINCTQLPGVLYFTQYAANAVAAYIRGGSVASLTLTALQALSGVITIAINGETVTSASIALSGATSFSNAASLITTGLGSSGDVFSSTASTAGSSTTLTIATTVSGALHVGDVIAGTGITGGTTIASFGTYTVLAGTGTVILSAAANVSSATAVTVSSTAICTYDSLRSAFVITSPTTGAASTIAFPTTDSFVTGLNLTQATGAVLSQGAAATTPAATMNNVLGVTQNWFSFMTVQQPALSVMEAFAAWQTAQQTPYLYANWDSNILATETPPQPTVFAQVVANYSGCASVYDAVGVIAAFVCGAQASVNYQEQNGYIVMAGKGNALLTPNVTSQTIYQNLVANGYSCYAAVATADQAFQWFQNGQISGIFDWIDEYAFSAWLYSQLQLAGMELINNTKSIPFNTVGAGLVYSAYKGAILQGVNFGGIQKGIELSPAQIAEVNQAAGVAIDGALFQTGWYLQVQIPNPQVQAVRGPWPATVYYTNPGGAQTLSFNAVNVQ